MCLRVGICVLSRCYTCKTEKSLLLRQTFLQDCQTLLAGRMVKETQGNFETSQQESAAGFSAKMHFTLIFLFKEYIKIYGIRIRRKQMHLG